MITLIAAVFAASIVGSLHCAGMCGGVLALAIGVAGGDATPRWRLQTAYHAGRLTTYSGLGLLAGAIGSTMDRATIAGIERPAAIVAGAVMIAFGAMALARVCGLRGLRVRSVPGWPALQRVTRYGYDFAFSRSGLLRAATLGLLTGLLPCGWLWVFVAAAAATGDAATGAITMAVFWSGTLPILAAAGAGMQALAGPLQRHLPKLTAIVLIAVGTWTVSARAFGPSMLTRLPGDAREHGIHAALNHIDSIDESDLPCCTHDDVDDSN